MAILWEHHIIPKKFKGHRAFRGLDEQMFGVEAPHNLIYLPADYVLARKMGVSPHPGGHDFRYFEAVGKTLDEIAKEEDSNLRAREIRYLMDAMRVGLVNGDLYTNAPLGGTGEEVARGVETVIADYAQYREKNLNQVDALGKFEQRSAETGNHHLGKWSAIPAPTAGSSRPVRLRTIRSAQTPHRTPTVRVVGYSELKRVRRH
jgi:hypothetical protein